jgi:hypothetical protein
VDSNSGAAAADALSSPALADTEEEDDDNYDVRRVGSAHPGFVATSAVSPNDDDAMVAAEQQQHCTPLPNDASLRAVFQLLAATGDLTVASLAASHGRGLTGLGTLGSSGTSGGGSATLARLVEANLNLPRKSLACHAKALEITARRVLRALKAADQGGACVSVNSDDSDDGDDDNKGMNAAIAASLADACVPSMAEEGEAAAEEVAAAEEEGAEEKEDGEGDEGASCGESVHVLRMGRGVTEELVKAGADEAETEEKEVRMVENCSALAADGAADEAAALRVPRREPLQARCVLQS